MKNPLTKDLISTNKMLVESLKEANQTIAIYTTLLLNERTMVTELQKERDNLKIELCKKK